MKAVERGRREAAPLDLERVRQALVVHPGRDHRFRQRHMMVDDVGDDVVDHRDDARPARCPHQQHQAALGIQHDARRHRGEHALPRRDRVRLALYQAIDVRPSRCRGEVIHLVIEQKARAGHRHRAPVEVVERRRAAHRVPFLVHHRVVRGGGAGVRTGHERRCGRGPTADALPQGGGVRLGQQAAGGVIDERRIAKIGVAVGEGAAHRFRLEVDERRRAERRERIVALQDVEDLSHGDAARRRGRHRIDRVIPVADGDRVTPDRAVAGEVFAGDEAAPALHLRHDQVRHPPAVEAVGAGVADRRQRRGQIGLAEHGAGHRRRPVGQKARAGGGEADQPSAVAGDRPAPVLVHQEAIVR